MALKFPPLTGHAQLLASWLNAVGLSLSGAMGPVPITWSEVAAWASLTGVDPEPWEAEALVDASRAYVSTLHESADKPAYLAPWQFRLTGEEAKRAEDAVTAGWG